MPLIDRKDVIFDESPRAKIISPKDVIFSSARIISPEDVIFDEKPVKEGTFGVSGSFEKPGLISSFKHGLKSSIPGMAITQEVPEYYEGRNVLERTAQSAGQIIPDLPFYTLGGYAGGGAGAFALPAGIRKVLMDTYSKGQAKTWDDVKDRFKGAMLETGKGAIVGKAMGMAGKYAPGITKFPAELTTLTTVSSGIEGQIPTAQDFIDSAILLGGMHGIQKGAGVLRNHYAKTGEHPKTVIKRIENEIPVEKMYDQADIELKALRKKPITERYQDLKRVTVDTSANIKKNLLNKYGADGKEAVIRHDLIKGSSTKSESIINDYSDKIYSGLSKMEERLLNRVIQSRRTIAIEKYNRNIKHPGGLGASEHEVYLKSIPEKLSTKLNAKADIYFNAMKENLKLMKDEGLITSKAHSLLSAYGDYSPRKFIQYIDPDRTYTFSGRKITVTDSGIKKLSEGSFRMLENNSRLLLSQVISRTQQRIFKNRANKALFEIAKQYPKNDFIKIAQTGKKTPGGYEKISVLISGQSKEMTMPSRMAREWVQSDPQINVNLANWIGWLSGAKVLRGMATGYNPEFALTNFPRDMAHIWLTTSEYSRHLPRTAVQMGRELAVTLPEASGFHPLKGMKSLLSGHDYKSVLKDTFNRKGAWKDYIDEGGGMQFLTHQGKLRPKGIFNIVKPLQDMFSYLGETSEIWNRLALRNRAIRNGKSNIESTWIARNYLDFSQGGSYIKAADSGIPYLNASIQGTRGLVRAASQKPVEFTYKVAQMGALATGLYLANKHTNPDCLDSVNDREKINNFIITTPFEYKDKQGNKRYLYYKIAKDQGQRLFCTVFENMMAKYMGEDINVDQVAQAAKDFIPIIPSETLPPTLDALLGYASNKDFWRNEDIWRTDYGGVIESKEEYTSYTNPALIALGEKTGLSPERSKYVLTQLFTYQNIYTDMVGGGFRKIFDTLQENEKVKTSEEILTNLPFIRRVYKTTYPFSKYQQAIKDKNKEENTRKYVQNREFYNLLDSYYSGLINKAAVLNFISKQPIQDKKPLFNKFQSYGRIYNIPDRRWWVNLQAMAPEPRAVIFWDRYKNADVDESEKLTKYMRIVPGIYTERFVMKLNSIKK